MEIVFLGTAAASAMPLPFCACDTCLAARRLGGKDLRKRSSVAVNSDLLIDLGPDSVSACAQYGVDLTKIKYILQTHAHSDHFDAGHLITRHSDYAVKNMPPATIVASNGTLLAMNRMLRDEYAQADLFSAQFLDNLKLSIVEVSHLETIQLGDYKITAFDSLHDPAQQALVYFVEHKQKTLFYGADLARIAHDVYEWLAGRYMDAVVLDQTYGDNCGAGDHFNSVQVASCVERLAAMDCIDEKTRVYATHISHEGNPTHERARALATRRGYDIAYDGLKVVIR